MKFDNLLYYARLFDGLPNVPYLHFATLSKISTLLESFGIKKKLYTNNLTNGAFAIDDYCLYVNFKRGNSDLPIIIDSHIDHPGFVLDKSGKGIALGSVGLVRLEKLISNGIALLDVYDYYGNYLTTKKIVNFEYKTKPVITLENNIGIVNNSHGVWQLPKFREDEKYIYMRNADNMIATALMMALIDDIAHFPSIFKNIDVTFIFTFLEEVFEVSANHVAMNKSTPFGKITPKSNIIVLESMQSIPLHSDENTIQNKLISQNLKDIRLFEDQVFYFPESRSEFFNNNLINNMYDKYGLSIPNYENGLQIKINDTDCVYGTYFEDQSNNIEEIILNILETEKFQYQHSLSGGACNGTSYSIFPTTSNIVTLNIPNMYKHNIGSAGEVVPEIIKKEDIINTYNALLTLLTVGPYSGRSRGLSKLLKQNNILNDRTALKKIQIERSNVTWGAHKKLSKQKYFPDNVVERLQFGLEGLNARLREKLEII